MNIEFDSAEYKDLLDILHIADVVISGHRKTEDTRTVRHRTLIQKLYGAVKSAGLDGMMSFNDELGTYVPTPDFEHSTVAHIVLDEFANHLFWDHLINRLTERDAAQLAGGVDRLRAMDKSDRHRLESAIRQRYAEEFGANDIANLRLIEPSGAAGSVPIKTSD
jgi:hypothetical protein